MSPAPHEPAPPRAETKNRRLPGSGVGQKSADAEFTGAGRWTGVPQGASTAGRLTRQMSFGSVEPPTAPGRVEAKYRVRPSKVSIGQPSAWGLLMPVSGTAVPHGPGLAARPMVGAANARR